MMKLVKFLSAAGLLTAGVAGLTAAQAQQRAEPQGPMCSVTVERTQPAGVLDVTRQVFEDGSCNCFIYTGPETQSNPVEATLDSILQSRRCPGARPMAVQGRGPGAGASTGAGAAGVKNAVPVLLFAGAAAGTVLLIEDDEDNTSPVTPVSP